MTATSAPANRPAFPPIQVGVVSLAALALLGLGLVAASAQSARMSALLVVGALLGVVLYHAVFGFTSAFRVLIADGRSAGVRAQMIMLGVACALFFPALAAGTLFGQPVGGFVAPAGVGLAVGAFVFGIGMQLGGACASGTLFTVGGGSVRMVVTLVFFIIGSVIGLEHAPFWESLPSLGSISVLDHYHWSIALALNLAAFGAIWMIVARIELARHGRLAPIASRGNSAAGGPSGWARLLTGPWPLVAGAIALAVLNFATLYLAGRPWGITAAFALWGAKAMNAVGVDIANWSSWASPEQRAALQASVMTDITSVMNFGTILGALAAAGLGGKFAPDLRIPMRSLIAAIVGGLMLGYGARLSYGCNIGAFFSGIASGSLHGWMWIFFAMFGNWAGTAMRPFFALPVERTQTAC